MKCSTAPYRLLWLAALLILVSLSCALPGSIPANHTPTERPDLPLSPGVEPPESQEPSRSSDAQIDVDYVYTSNLITVLYPLYGSKLDDFAIITIHNHRSTPVKVIVESEVTGYTTPSVDTVTVEAEESIEVRQNPRLIPEKIDQLNVQKPAQFHLRVVELAEGEERPLLKETGETLVYARRDFPWSIPGFTADEVFELLAALVTPNDPAVEELIRTAANYTSSGTMWNGYGGHLNDEGGGVWERLEAIWQAESKDYNLTYISTWVSYAPGSVQRIRLPAEVLEQRSGNCIETSLLFAAAAEALDLEAAIVGIPGHAFMGVRIDPENANYYFIETTLIGRASFKEAVDYGNQEFQDALPHLEAKEDHYGWVTIWNARAKGILPLPWH